MTVEKFFDEWWTPKDLPENGFNKTAMLDFAEMYHRHLISLKTNKSEEFNKLALPLLEFLRANYHPHVKVVIDDEKAELVETVIGIKDGFDWGSVN